MTAPELKGPGLIVSDLHFTRKFQEHRDRPKLNFLLQLIPRFTWALEAGDGVTILPGEDYEESYRAIERTPWAEAWDAFSRIYTVGMPGTIIGKSRR